MLYVKEGPAQLVAGGQYEAGGQDEEDGEVVISCQKRNTENICLFD